MWTTSRLQSGKQSMLRAKNNILQRAQDKLAHPIEKWVPASPEYLLFIFLIRQSGRMKGCIQENTQYTYDYVLEIYTQR